MRGSFTIFLAILIFLALSCCHAESGSGGGGENDGEGTTQQDAMEEEESEEETHPWFFCNWTGNQPCALGYFCTLDNDGELKGSRCEICPSLEEKEAGATCESLAASSGVVSQEGFAEQCNKFCKFGQDGDPCSDDVLCEPEKFFCDYRDGPEQGGICRACGSEKTDCLADDLAVRGQEDCLESCDLNCFPIDWTTVLVDGIEYISRPMIGSPGISATGPLVDCTNLVQDDEFICEGAEGAICLIEDENKDVYNYEMVLKCQESGGVGMILFAYYPEHSSRHDPINGQLSFKETSIPSVSISHYNGTYIKETLIGATATVTVDNIGDYCWKQMSCQEDVPCIGKHEDDFCAFDWGDHGGWCWTCPTDDDGNPDPFGCYFDKTDKGNVFSQQRIESCAEKCGATLDFDSCKFCPSDVSTFDFGISSPEDKCYFCPENDVEYPDREVPIFGNGTKCWQMQKFFNRVDISKDSQNCLLAQSMNYICGCGGTGYGGAKNETRKKVLAWLPRVSAFLSLLGSGFIVYDCFQAKEKRKAIFYQLMAVLSVFDIFGSLGYIFTTLPIPAEDYMYGAHGNESICIAQGFFIQLGTISCYTNVSLAFYYYLVIKVGWTEHQMTKIRLLLFACPIIVGLAFAFAGIPFYDNMILWCNNAESWWPDIPVAIAIFIATVVMGSVCWDVYRKEKASNKWRMAGERAHRKKSLSNRVFWQSFWYIVAFYITWVPYLALQYTWASGKAFSKYGFILFAGTMVPLQGAWNCFVYIRPRYLKGIKKRISRSSSILKHGMPSSLKHLTGVGRSKEEEVMSNNSTQQESSRRTSPNLHETAAKRNAGMSGEHSSALEISATANDMTWAHEDPLNLEESAPMSMGGTESLEGIEKGGNEAVDPVMPDTEDEA